MPEFAFQLWALFLLCGSHGSLLPPGPSLLALQWVLTMVVVSWRVTFSESVKLV